MNRGQTFTKCRRGEMTMEPMRTSVLQPKQWQELLSRPSNMADSPGQDLEVNLPPEEVDQRLGVGPAIGTTFKTIGGKPSRHRPTGGEHHHCSTLRFSESPLRQLVHRGCKYRSATSPCKMDRIARAKGSNQCSNTH